jgi:hypothetical protein
MEVSYCTRDMKLFFFFGDPGVLESSLLLNIFLQCIPLVSDVYVKDIQGHPRTSSIHLVGVCLKRVDTDCEKHYVTTFG